MANTSVLHLTIVSQEKQLLSQDISSLTAPSTEGEITILPLHVPLFTQLQAGVVTYVVNKQPEQLVVSKGFLDVGPDGEVTIMVDAAVHARDISLEKAEEAVKAAHESMSITRDQRELVLAEASLKQALLEIKVARSTRRASN